VRTELTLAAVFCLAIALWFGGFYYSAEMAAGTLLLLALVYFPFGFYFLAVRGRQNLVFSIVTGVVLFMAPVCLVLALFNFAQARVQTGAGICVLPVFLFITYLAQQKAPQELRPYYHAQLLRTGAWLLISIVLFLSLPLDMPRF
jgi:hypothetical protein